MEAPGETSSFYVSIAIRRNVASGGKLRSRQSFGNPGVTRFPALGRADGNARGIPKAILAHDDLRPRASGKVEGEPRDSDERPLDRFVSKMRDRSVFREEVLLE
jgi:hypothetical protein